MTTANVHIPRGALQGLASYEKDGVLHHVGPFGVAVERDGGWRVAGFTARIDEADAVLMVATGAPRRAEFGPVLILGGTHRGRLGYYDDEEDDGTMAVVYFGEPFTDDFELVPVRHLVSVDVTLMSIERYRREDPETFVIMGLPSRPESSETPG